MPEHNAIISDEQNDLKKRATRRLIVAVSLVLAAVAILTVLSKQKPSKPVAPELPSTVVQQTPQPAIVPQPAIEPTPAPEQATIPIEEPASAAAPESLPEAPPPPQVSAQPALKQATPSVSKRPDHAQPSLTVVPSTKTAPPPKVEPIAKTTSPLPAKLAAEPVPATKPQPTTTSPKAFVVQLGVFSNPANAIQLQEKLSQHGIQSYTETRVHVGPFKDKIEAEKAMAKIRALGIGAVVVQH